MLELHDLESANALRLAIFASALLVLLAWQQWRPYQALKDSMSWRGLNHLALMLIGILAMRFMGALSPWLVAVYAQQQGFGLFHLLSMPLWLGIVLSLLCLDAWIYWQHRLMHRIPLLWRLHKVHHTDTSVDVTTALRFHPLELMFSVAFKALLVGLLGAPVLAVVIFDVLLSTMALFVHSNLSTAPTLSCWIKRILVTPEMHRIHHSRYQPQTDSNYGTVLTLWDKCFGSYRENEVIEQWGLDEHRDRHSTRLDSLLLQPFDRRDKSTGTKH